MRADGWLSTRQRREAPMPAEDDLRLAWLAHREGLAGRRDALLTLAAATPEGQSSAWVGAVRDYLVAAHPGHLFAGFYHVDEVARRPPGGGGLDAPAAELPALPRPQPAEAGGRRAGPFTGRKFSVALALDEMLAPAARSSARRSPCRCRPRPRRPPRRRNRPSRWWRSTSTCCWRWRCFVHWWSRSRGTARGRRERARSPIPDPHPAR